jgi:hypothetical protein
MSSRSSGRNRQKWPRDRRWKVFHNSSPEEFDRGAIREAFYDESGGPAFYEAVRGKLVCAHGDAGRPFSLHPRFRNGKWGAHMGVMACGTTVGIFLASMHHVGEVVGLSALMEGLDVPDQVRMGWCHHVAPSCRGVLWRALVVGSPKKCAMGAGVPRGDCGGIGLPRPLAVVRPHRLAAGKPHGLPRPGATSGEARLPWRELPAKEDVREVRHDRSSRAW